MTNEPFSNKNMLIRHILHRRFITYKHVRKLPIQQGFRLGLVAKRQGFLFNNSC